MKSSLASSLTACMTVLALALASPGAYAQPIAARGPLIVFDLPAQPLRLALEQFDARTSLSVFFPSALAEGRTSSAVHGLFTPEQALHRLLEGTGLTVQPAAREAFVLIAAEGAAAAPSGSQPPGQDEAPAGPRRLYDALVQARVRQALCATPGIALGAFRLALRLRIAASGQVREARLLDTTGDAARDAAILRAVRQVEIGHAPEDPARPFVLLVRPREPGMPPACPVLH